MKVISFLLVLLLSLESYSGSFERENEELLKCIEKMDVFFVTDPRFEETIINRERIRIPGHNSLGKCTMHFYRKPGLYIDEYFEMGQDSKDVPNFNIGFSIYPRSEEDRYTWYYATVEKCEVKGESLFMNGTQYYYGNIGGVPMPWKEWSYFDMEVHKKDGIVKTMIFGNSSLSRNKSHCSY